MRPDFHLVPIVAAALAVAGCFHAAEKKDEPGPAAWNFDETRKYLDGNIPKFESFADIEYSRPLTIAERAALMPADLAKMTQEEIDQVYARLTAGAIPDGIYPGEVLLKAGTKGQMDPGGFSLGYFGKLIVEKGLATADKSFDVFAGELWKGKEFSRREGRVRNGISAVQVLRAKGLVEGSPPTGMMGGRNVTWLFTAKLYCGQSLLDSRRESVVIDYLFAEEVEGYRELPDFLAGRRGLQVRDEMRMVRPGLYIGRAYMNRIFVLTFVLHNEEVDKASLAAFRRAGPDPAAEDCWVGTQSPGGARR